MQNYHKKIKSNNKIKKISATHILKSNKKTFLYFNIINITAFLIL